MSYVPCSMSCVPCPMSYVPCPMSCVPCPVSYVLCPVFHVHSPVSLSADVSQTLNKPPTGRHVCCPQPIGSLSPRVSQISSVKVGSVTTRPSNDTTRLRIVCTAAQTSLKVPSDRVTEALGKVIQRWLTGTYQNTCDVACSHNAAKEQQVDVTLRVYQRRRQLGFSPSESSTETNHKAQRRRDQVSGQRSQLSNRFMTTTIRTRTADSSEADRRGSGSMDRPWKEPRVGPDCDP
ncbi:hypothetical protein F2P81_006724 [Scophthalmus maximus]|uniref:Uncharacterized protein n=1 Tax=Scophthalmus maximus TaxID=52904 RepID=A0A6A4T026_SCOMX|nr:hypothetical protein F2P81_006724 [Scophthalmus maximus]